MQDAIILEHVMEHRKQMPRIGTRKLHYLLKPELAKHGISIGRDYLFDLLLDHGLLVRRRKRRISTTNSRHRFRKYPNLIKDQLIDRPDQVWVSDITYITLEEGFSYLSLITDLYSKRIVGYHLGEDLSTRQSVKALKMALLQRTTDTQLIHHSDRGIQYCSNKYVAVLHTHKLGISMTQKSDPYENAVAERVNGILKQEFNMSNTFQSHHKAARAVHQAIRIYNQMRPHSSCDYRTPDQAHANQGAMTRRWKNYYHKHQNQQSQEHKDYV